MTLLRIPVLIALMIASGPLQYEYGLSRILLTLDSAVSALPTWLGLVAVAVVFVLAATYGRDRKHATPILVLELVVAAIVALVPPLIWLQVAPGPWNEAMGGTSGATFSQVLAVVWAMVAIRTFRTRGRGVVADV